MTSNANNVSLHPIPTLSSRYCPSFVNAAFARNLATLHAYVAEFGDLPATDTLVNGHGLGKWTQRLRGEKRKGILDPDLVAALELIPGWEWDRPTGKPVNETQWLTHHQHLLDTVTTDGWEAVGTGQFGSDRFLFDWVRRQQDERAAGRLSAPRIRLLEEVPGWEWLSGPRRTYSDRRYVPERVLAR